jgi:hypothetical protein
MTWKLRINLFYALVSSLECFTVLITTNSRLPRYDAMFIQLPTFRISLPPQPWRSEMDRTFRRVRFSREKRLLPCLMSVRPFILPHVIGRLPLYGFPWNLILGGGVYVNLSRHLNLVKIRGYIGHLTQRPKYVLLLPATFKSLYFCVTRTMPILLHPTRFQTFCFTKRPTRCSCVGWFTVPWVLYMFRAILSLICFCNMDSIWS